jgi:hypothetical protein
MTLPRKTYNPKAPHRRVPSGDVQSQRDAFVHRLTILGAAPDVLEAVRDNWNDPEWVERDQVVAMDDVALAAELAGIEREYHEGTHTEEEDDDLAARLALEQAAAEQLHETVPVVNNWVDDDDDPPARAFAVEAAEAARPEPRKGILDHAAKVIAAAEGD